MFLVNLVRGEAIISLNFDEKKIQEVKDEYKKIKISPGLKQLVDGSAQIAKKFLDIPLLAAKGVSWLSIKEWQSNNRMKVQDITNMSKLEQEKVTIEVYEIYKKRLAKLLVNPEEQKDLFDETMDKLEKYGREMGRKISI